MYLELLDLFKILVIIFLGILFAFFLIRKASSDKNIQFIIVAKAIVVYEVISFFVYLIYSKDFLTGIFGINLRILDFVFFSVILFLFFRIIVRKYFKIKTEKIVTIYLLLVFLFLPFLNVLGEIFVVKNIITIPPFRSEIIEMKNSFSELSLFEIASESYQVSFLSKTVNLIESGTISWPWNSISLIMITQDFSKIKFQRISPL